MSIRTIVEINNDFLHELRGRPAQFIELLDMIEQGTWRDERAQHILGIRVLADRHHSSKLELTVG